VVRRRDVSPGLSSSLSSSQRRNLSDSRQPFRLIPQPSRRRALSIGLLSGGYSKQELEEAGAFRVYTDPADMLLHIEDLGIPGN